MNNVTATATGGRQLRRVQHFVVADDDNVTATATGGSSSYGVYNTSSSPTMNNVTATATGGPASDYGVYNSSSSPTMNNVTATATGGSSSYGVYNSLVVANDSELVDHRHHQQHLAEQCGRRRRWLTPHWVAATWPVVGLRVLVRTPQLLSPSPATAILSDFANLAALPGFGSRVVAERPVIQFDALAEYKRHDSHRSRLPADLTLSKGQTDLTRDGVLNRCSAARQQHQTRVITTPEPV